jgi:SAM-dependent methyltransferase
VLLGPTPFAAVTADRLLSTLLEVGGLADPGLERFLTRLRSCLLDRAAHRDAAAALPADELRLLCALARQCFISEYAFALAPGENERVQALRDRVAAALQSRRPVAPSWIAAVAAYDPLHLMPEAGLLLARPWPAPVEELLTLQVREPEQERACRDGIAPLTAIDDATSLRVKEQYEENPYPRWTRPALAPAPVTIDAHLRRMFPAAPFRPLRRSGELDVLIAGCGTGQHLALVARRLARARILAVDLSLASLCYAKRQAAAIGLDNVAFGMADILQINSLGRSFDVIEAVGSLQALADPRQGWRALVRALRPGGLLFLGLYSDIARRDIVATRRFIAERGFDAAPDGIRRFRHEVMESPEGTSLKNVSLSPDFYSISDCRDLLFHVQEVRTTLPEIAACLKENDLAFVGFEIDTQARRRYATAFPADTAMTDLDAWQRFETANPATFVRMYQFWAQKAG